MEELKTRNEFAYLIDSLCLKVGVEVGVAKGDFSEYLLQHSKLEKLYSIDAWSTDLEAMRAFRTKSAVAQTSTNYDDAIRRLARFGDRSQIIKNLSENAVKIIPDDSLDFVYLYGSHKFSGFAMDLVGWWPKLRAGGIFAGHDFLEHKNYQVIQCVKGFAKEHRLSVYQTKESRPSWYCMKP
jgi:hypothetical protein